MVQADQRPEKEGFVLVRFFHGDNLSQQELYTDWDQSLQGHKSEPRMALRIPENTGTFDDTDLRIILPEDIFTIRASSGTPHSPIFVIVSEATQALELGDQGIQRVLFRGRVMKVVKNFQGKKGRIAFMAQTLKARLDQKLSFPCTHQCVWTLFKGNCGAVEGDFEINTEIDSVSGFEVTIVDTEVTDKGVSDARYWKRGYMEKDGLRITIRDYDGATDVQKFQMVRKVPSDWIGGTNDIRIVPGCDKTVETCRSRFDQEETFMGPGYKMLQYHPLFENPK